MIFWDRTGSEFFESSQLQFRLTGRQARFKVWANLSETDDQHWQFFTPGPFQNTSLVVRMCAIVF